jgi:hypothetical protein
LPIEDFRLFVRPHLFLPFPVKLAIENWQSKISHPPQLFMAGPVDQSSNPFATRFIRPGALPYLFPPGVSVEKLVDDLAQQGWHGAIIGPHGTGKSSLLVALKPELERRGRKVVQQQLQGGQRRLDWTALDWNAWTKETLVIIDGYEQLSHWQRLLLRARCYRRGAGLLVTAHQPVQLPTIFTAQPTTELAQKIVQQLIPAGDERITPNDVAAAFAEQQGNIRETLLKLFDVYRNRQ